MGLILPQRARVGEEISAQKMNALFSALNSVESALMFKSDSSIPLSVATRGRSENARFPNRAEIINDGYIEDPSAWQKRSDIIWRSDPKMLRYYSPERYDLQVKKFYGTSNNYHSDSGTTKTVPCAYFRNGRFKEMLYFDDYHCDPAEFGAEEMTIEEFRARFYYILALDRAGDVIDAQYGARVICFEDWKNFGSKSYRDGKFGEFRKQDFLPVAYFTMRINEWDDSIEGQDAKYTYYHSYITSRFLIGNLMVRDVRTYEPIQ